MPFRILRTVRIEELENQVSELMKDGWLPYGEIHEETYANTKERFYLGCIKNEDEFDPNIFTSDSLSKDPIDIITVPESAKAPTVIGTKKNVGIGLSGYSDETSELFGTDRNIKLEDTLKMIGVSSFKRKETVILQAFNMRFSYIKDKLKHIARAGYTHIQISPPTKSLDDTGVWWELYQPISFKEIGNKLGTREDLSAMIDEAHRVGLKVLVDVVLNHMADPARRKDVDLQNPLKYPEFEARHFNYSSIYLDYHFFAIDASNEVSKRSIAVYNASRETTPEFREWYLNYSFDWFHSDKAKIFRDFKDYVTERSLFDIRVDSIPYDSENFRWATIRFLSKYIPLRYNDFKSKLSDKIGDDRAEEALLIDTVSELEKFKAEKKEDFDATEALYSDFFGRSILIVRLDYWNITYGEVLGQNEWDTLIKAQEKWFPGLPDLNTGLDEVKQVHAEYLKDLLLLGADGFRVDAVKHIPKGYIRDLLRIIAKMDLPDSVKKREIYTYGEMATDDANIANSYRNYMSMTDFFLQDHVAKVMVPWSQISMQELSAKRMEEKRKSWSFDSGYAPFLFPDPDGEVSSTALLSDKISGLFQASYDFKSAVIFSRLHDSVVGTMYKIYDYKAVLLSYAYILAARPGEQLVYWSDEDILKNAGPDYAEPIVVAGILFRQAMHGYRYTGDFSNQDYLGVDSSEIIFIDRQDQGLAVISRKFEGSIMSMSNLKDGIYREIISGQDIMVKSGRPSREVRIKENSVAYFLPRRLYV